MGNVINCSHNEGSAKSVFFFFSEDSETISSFSELCMFVFKSYVSESCTWFQATHAVCMGISISPSSDILLSCSLSLTTLAYQMDFLHLIFRRN